MDGKIKIGIAIALAAGICITGYQAISDKLHKDPVITGLQAKFIGEVGPGESLSKKMFEVKGVTESGQLVPLSNFSSETGQAAENGDSCEVDIQAQGYSTTTIVNITREPVFTKNIGYPNEDSAVVTCYKNGDLEFFVVQKNTGISYPQVSGIPLRCRINPEAEYLDSLWTDARIDRDSCPE